MIDVNEETKGRLRRLFAEKHWHEVEDLLRTECGDNLPLVKSAYGELAERIRFAVLKLSNGKVEDLKKNINEARRDWRDVLVAAGFADSPAAHKDWNP